MPLGEPVARAGRRPVMLQGVGCPIGRDGRGEEIGLDASGRTLWPIIRGIISAFCIGVGEGLKV